MNNPLVRTTIWVLKKLLLGILMLCVAMGIVYLLILIPENIGDIIVIVCAILFFVFAVLVIVCVLTYEIKNKYRDFKEEEK